MDATTEALKPLNARYIADNFSGGNAPKTEYALSPEKFIDFGDFQQKYNVSPRYSEKLSKLSLFTTVLVLDDSGSMASAADESVDFGSDSRWTELRKAVEIILEALKLCGNSCDVYFLNRGVHRNIQTIAEIEKIFDADPYGATNIVNALTQIQKDHVTSDMRKPLLCYLFSDGIPTNSYGGEDFPGLDKWLRMRLYPQRTFFSIVLCTGDEAVEAQYRKLEDLTRRKGLNLNPTSQPGVINVDVTGDFRQESKTVACSHMMETITQGSFPFTFGDYIVKILVGSIDPHVHQLDAPPCQLFGLSCTIS